MIVSLHKVTKTISKWTKRATSGEIMSHPLRQRCPVPSLECEHVALHGQGPLRLTAGLELPAVTVEQGGVTVEQGAVALEQGSLGASRWARGVAGAWRESEAQSSQEARRGDAHRGL